MQDQRSNAFNWFLTFSQMGDLRPIDPEHSLELFLAYMAEALPDNPVKWVMLCHEDHAPLEEEEMVDHGVHIHIVFALTKRWKCPADMEFFDALYGKHPHIQVCRKPQHAIRYAGKDGDFDTYNVDFEAICTALDTKKGYSFEAAANEIKKGTTLEQLWEIAPAFVLREKRKLEECISITESWKRNKIILPRFPGFQKSSERTDPAWQVIIDWANKNFLKPRRKRQKQLWIWSKEFKIGKSWPWAVTLREYFRCYEWNKGDKQAKDLLTCQYILIDELTGGITVGTLKSLSQMMGMMVDIKYGDLTWWNLNVPCIVTSNKPPAEVYKNCAREDIESLESRFKIANPYLKQFCKVKEEEDALPSPPTEEEEHSEYSQENFHQN